MNEMNQAFMSYILNKGLENKLKNIIFVNKIDDEGIYLKQFEYNDKEWDVDNIAIYGSYQNGHIGLYEVSTDDSYELALLFDYEENGEKKANMISLDFRERVVINDLINLVGIETVNKWVSDEARFGNVMFVRMDKNSRIRVIGFDYYKEKWFIEKVIANQGIDSNRNTIYEVKSENTTALALLNISKVKDNWHIHLKSFRQLIILK